MCSQPRGRPRRARPAASLAPAPCCGAGSPRSRLPARPPRLATHRPPRGRAAAPPPGTARPRATGQQQRPPPPWPGRQRAPQRRSPTEPPPGSDAAGSPFPPQPLPAAIGCGSPGPPRSARPPRTFQRAAPQGASRHGSLVPRGVINAFIDIRVINTFINIRVINCVSTRYFKIGGCKPAV